MVDPLHCPFDEILDIYVRDGLVYYLRSSRSAANSIATSQSLGEIGAETLKGWPRERQLAFWINAYNAFVLQTVIDDYPIRGGAPLSRDSIRQIPGAFERRTFRAVGRIADARCDREGRDRPSLAIARRCSRSAAAPSAAAALKSEAFTSIGSTHS